MPKLYIYYYFYIRATSFPVCLRSVFLSFFRFLCLDRSRDVEDDVLVLAFFFLRFFVNRRVTTARVVGILYARYTRRNAYKTDNFRPVGWAGGGVFVRLNSLVRWIKNTVLTRRIQGATQTTIITHRVYGTPFAMSNDGTSMYNNIVLNNIPRPAATT